MKYLYIYLNIQKVVWPDHSLKMKYYEHYETKFRWYRQNDFFQTSDFHHSQSISNHN